MARQTATLTATRVLLAAVLPAMGVLAAASSEATGTVAAPGGAGPKPALRPGHVAADLELPDLARDGAAYRLSERLGPDAGAGRARAVLVAFVASWCGPCKRSLPQLAEHVRERGDDLELVIVTTDEKPEGRRREVELVKAAGLDVPVLDPTPEALSAYLGGQRSVPRFFLLDHELRVRATHRGYGKNAQVRLPRLLDRVLGPLPTEPGASDAGGS